MAQIKVRGIVIEEAPMGEKDKRLIVLTAEQGKISVLAKGAKSQKSRFAAPSQLFCISDFVLDTGRTFFYIKEYEIRETFFDLRTDMDRFTYASVMVDAARVFSIDGENNAWLLRLLVQGFRKMQKEGSDPLMISQTFLFRMLCESGFRPELENCVRCGRPYPDNETAVWFFHPEEGGLICPDCARGIGKMPLRPGSVAALRYIANADTGSVYHFSVTDAIRIELIRPVRDSVSLHAGFLLKSLSFAGNMENLR